MDNTPKVRAASQRTKTKTLKAVEWEENQTYLKSIEYEADRMMAQQMLDEQSWKGGNKYIPREIRSVLPKKVMIRMEEEEEKAMNGERSHDQLEICVRFGS